MKRFAAGFATGTVVLALGIVAYLRLGFTDVRADVPAAPWVARWMDASTHASVHRQAATVVRPNAPSEETLIAGGTLYRNDCVGCHGATGKPRSEFGAAFYPPAPQLALDGTTYDDAEIFWVAKHGTRRTGMGAQDAYSDDQMRQLAAFIRRMRELPPGVIAALQEKPGQ